MAMHDFAIYEPEARKIAFAHTRLRFKLAMILCVSLTTFARSQEPSAAIAARLGPSPPAISSVDQTYLTRFVRRVMTHAARDGRHYEPVYVPVSLQESNCRASVSLRRAGKLIATADSDALPVLQACRQAAEAALDAARRKGSIAEADIAAMTIEIELIGPRERVGSGKDAPEQVANRFEPALHGIAAAFDEKEILVRPSQLISMETFCDNDEELDHQCNRYQIALENLHKKLGLLDDPPERKPETVAICRFRTLHWVEPQPDAEPVELIAGMRLIRPRDAAQTSLPAVADDLARYLRYRQNSDGLFSYEFLPGRDMYWPKEPNWVRQAAAAWALAAHASHRHDHASEEAFARAIEAFRKMVRPLSDSRDAAFIATPDGRHPLGATALFCLALMNSPQADREADLLATLLNGLAAMQREDGSFRTNFPPSASESSQDYFPGEALLAIAKEYVLTRDAKWREICDRALPFYTAYFRKNRPPAFAPWHMQAWGRLARTTQLRRYADFVYELADFIAATQTKAEEPPLAIYDGAFDVHGTGRGGIATAVYVEGLIEAARTAQALGDRDRAERYRAAIHRACRFLVQLRFRPEECYYVQSPRDVVGAMRNSPADPTLRIDHSQHALSALLGAVELAPESQPATDQAPNDSGP